MRSLHQAIIQAEPNLIVPCDDDAVLQLHALYQVAPALRPIIERSLGDASAYPVLASREHLLAVAKELGIRVPATKPIATEGDLKSWKQASTVIKRDGSSGGSGVAIAHTRADALASYRVIAHPLTLAKALKRSIINRDPLVLWLQRTQAKPAVVLQQFIPGRAANSMLTCWQGELLANVTVEAIASQGPTGAATVVRLIKHAEIDEAARQLTRKLNLSGFHGLDFVLEEDPSGQLTGAAWLIELNPRCTQLGHLNLPAQGDLAGILAARVSGHPHTALPHPITSQTVAFYPQAQQWNPHSPHLAEAFVDRPQNASALNAELLLEPWPYRQLPARIYHYFFPPNRHSRSSDPPAGQHISNASEATPEPTS